jgi:hypothetical protein
MESRQQVVSQAYLISHFIPYLMQHGTLYAKFKTVKARPAYAGEIIVTNTADGFETINKASDGDMVVQNETSSGEVYIVSKNKFNDRYISGDILQDGWRRYHPVGRVIAMHVDAEILALLGSHTAISIDAPWGETMPVRQGDYLVTPPGDPQVYRIAAQEFAETYRTAEE